MINLEKVIKGIDICLQRFHCGKDCPYYDDSKIGCEEQLREDAINLLKDQEERLRKLQKDKDKLCLEVSKWKHKFHDAPPKFVSQGVVDQIRWERDTALSQLEQIGKGLGSKMDDIVALLKEQDAVEPDTDSEGTCYCGNCGETVGYYPVGSHVPEKLCMFCPKCSKEVKWTLR